MTKWERERKWIEWRLMNGEKLTTWCGKPKCCKVSSEMRNIVEWAYVLNKSNYSSNAQTYITMIYEDYKNSQRVRLMFHFSSSIRFQQRLWCPSGYCNLSVLWMTLNIWNPLIVVAVFLNEIVAKAKMDISDLHSFQ